MIFEEFLKDLRTEMKVSQKVLAEKAGTTPQNISSYERHKTTCSVDVALELLDALGVAIILENKQIKLKGDYENMAINEKKYEKSDLEFINFNAKECYDLYKSKILENERISKEENEKAFDKLTKNGYEVYFSRFFMDRLWDADHYPVGESLVAISKDDREIHLVVSGGVDIDFFLFEEFVSDIKDNHPQEGAYIEKVLMYECLNNSLGKDIYDTFKRRKNVSALSPLLNGYEDIINKTLNNKEYFYERYEEYDPRELTISDMLGIYDCYSSNYPYYAYKMPDGKIVLEYESFEGHDIWDALNHVEIGFDRIYDTMLQEYEEFPEEFLTI